MPKFAETPKQSRLDTTTVESISDLALASITTLARAEASMHSLISTFMMRPQTFALGVDSPKAISHGTIGNNDPHLPILVPPNVTHAHVFIRGVAKKHIGYIYSQEMDETAVSSASITVMNASDLDEIAISSLSDAAIQKLVPKHLAKADTFQTTKPLQLRTSASWDYHPMVLRIDRSTDGDDSLLVFGVSVFYIYPDTLP